MMKMNAGAWIGLVAGAVGLLVGVGNAGRGALATAGLLAAAAVEGAATGAAAVTVAGGLAFVAAPSSLAGVVQPPSPANRVNATTA